jgi:hypothetical protein
MNPPSIPQARHILCIGLAIVTSPITPSRADEPAAESKTHTLFMGLDLSIENQNAFHRVKDVSGDSFVITTNAAPVFLPTNRVSHNLKVSKALKLTSVSASITNFTSGRAYTVTNNPRMQRLKEMNMAVSALEANQALAIDRAAAISQEQPGIYAGIDDVSGSGAAAQLAAEDRAAKAFDDAMVKYNTSSILANSNLVMGSFYEGQAQGDLAQELFDAIEAEFELSAETPLNNPYMLLVAKFREPKAPPSSARNWIYAKSLDPIGSTPVKFKILKGGFPRGYTLDDFSVHLYNRGEEVATNISAKRVPLTRDEAFEYVKIQYVSSHKGATLPATPAMGKLPTDLHARLSGGQFNREYYVKVSKEGLAEAAFMDEACSEKIADPYLDNVVRSIRFKPALAKGKPVDAVARLKLEDLPL